MLAPGGRAGWRILAVLYSRRTLRGWAAGVQFSAFSDPPIEFQFQAADGIEAAAVAAGGGRGGRRRSLPGGRPRGEHAAAGTPGRRPRRGVLQREVPAGGGPGARRDADPRRQRRDHRPGAAALHVPRLPRPGAYVAAAGLLIVCLLLDTSFLDVFFFLLLLLPRARAQGCDASIMLVSRNGTAERDAFPSYGLRGYAEIEHIKAKLEDACPLTVSCADIIVMAARDAVYLVNKIIISSLRHNLLLSSIGPYQPSYTLIELKKRLLLVPRATGRGTPWRPAAATARCRRSTTPTTTSRRPPPKSSTSRPTSASRGWAGRTSSCCQVQYNQ
jgi:hypothetical protein